MATKTTKAALEVEISRLQTRISEQSDKITELLQDAEEGFLHSHTYQDLLRQLKAAELSAGFDKRDIERLKRENESLQNQIKTLQQAFSAASAPAKRGRRRTTSEEMRSEIKAMSDAGKSLREISADTGISKSTIHRIIHE